jgi:hypothetical protein
MPQSLIRSLHVPWAVGLLLLLGAPSAAAPGDDDTVWVEGESATVKHVQPNPWYSGAVRKEQMSGGDWLSHFSNGSDGSAQYDLTIPKDGDYVLWVRSNPMGGLAFQLNGGSWTEIPTKALDVVNLAEDDKPDLRLLGWRTGGKLSLKKGPATLAFKMHNHGSIDCFTLTTRAYEPRGILKPGEVQPPPFVPVLTDDNIRKWIDFIRPGDSDNKWERLEWRTELGAAIEEAKKLQRPILLWAMNGHPLGCT